MIKHCQNMLPNNMICFNRDIVIVINGMKVNTICYSLGMTKMFLIKFRCNNFDKSHSCEGHDRLTWHV